tara:strand:+ start:78 stop:251 length:174 start_codon:yes stop_codon:yes gene_type:complete
MKKQKQKQKHNERHGCSSHRHLMTSKRTPRLLALNPKLIRSMSTSPLETGKIRVVLQ